MLQFCQVITPELPDMARDGSIYDGAIGCTGWSRTGFQAFIVSIDKHLEAARHALSDFMGSAPDGALLVEKSDRVVALDASVCQVLGLEPMEALGQKLKKISEDLHHLPAAVLISQFKTDGTPYSIAKIEIGDKLAVGIWLNSAASEPIAQPAEEFSNEIDLLEPLLSRPSQDELMSWLGELFDRHSNHQLGAIALKQGFSMALWTSWPATEVPILPLRFNAEISMAFRTGKGGKTNSQTEPARVEGANIEPLIVNGQVIGLVVWQGKQPMVNRLLPTIPIALQRFVDKLED